MDKIKIVVEFDPNTGYIYDKFGAMYMTIMSPIEGTFELYKEPKNIVSDSAALSKAIDKYTAAEVIALKNGGVL